MQILDVAAAGSAYQYKWPSGEYETYPNWIEYRVIASDGEHRARIGFGMRKTYGRDRKRVVVWIDGHPQAEFLEADDFGNSGDLLSEIRVPGESGERMCRYPEEAVPDRYSGLPIVGIPTRVSGPGIHN